MTVFCDDDDEPSGTITTDCSNQLNNNQPAPWAWWSY